MVTVLLLAACGNLLSLPPEDYVERWVEADCACAAPGDNEASSPWLLATGGGHAVAVTDAESCESSTVDLLMERYMPEYVDPDDWCFTDDAEVSACMSVIREVERLAKDECDPALLWEDNPQCSPWEMIRSAERVARHHPRW